MATLCSGIGAPEVAASRVGGFESVFVAEIESFPCAVLKHHYPDVPNYGDMTKWRDWPANDLDLLIAGTPCQAFSVAGLRNSLDDDRGNLTLEMARYANHARPRFLLWENVPGVLNTKDNAFGCLLAALAGSDDALVPDGGRWTNAGFVSGPRRQIAWRILDAQYFGVPQRRRRIWLVAGDVERGAGDWACAAALFPVAEGLRWHPAPCGTAGEGVAGWVAPSLTGSGRGAARTGESRGQDCVIPATGYRKLADDDTASAMKARDYKGKTDVIASVTSKWAKGSGGPSGDECQNLVAHTLRAAGHDASEDGTGRGTPLVDVHDMRGNGDGETVPTLTGDHLNRATDYTPCVAFSAGNSGKAYGIGVEAEMSPPLRAANSGTNQVPSVAVRQATSAKCVHWAQGGGEVEDDLSGALRANAEHSYQFVRQIAPSLTATNDPSRSPQSSEVTQQVAPVHQTTMQVRRLTVGECERLQGFPDGYTAVQHRGKPAADGPRYKALGNSMAVPCVEFILAHLKATTTGGGE